jgi:aspartokinase-like uncharacterized kinase
MSLPRRVIKVGGSLFDLPELPARLRGWLAQQPPACNVLLAGGGAMADCIRQAHRLQGLDEETCHWLCIRVMSVTARLVAAMLPEAEVATALDAIIAANCESSRLQMVDPLPVLEQADAASPLIKPRPLPHTWDVTSDSIAAWVACRIEATELVLLKSALPPVNADAVRAAEAGYVDRYFPVASAELPCLWCVDLRGCEMPSVFLRLHK